MSFQPRLFHSSNLEHGTEHALSCNMGMAKEVINCTREGMSNWGEKGWKSVKLVLPPEKTKSGTTLQPLSE